jgi:DNA-binding NtrC family response regulator
MPHALIVDDDTEVLEWLGQIVRAEGFTTATADSLRNARAQLVRQAPDVLFTDLQLSDGLGTDLVGDLESRVHTEVVVITGHASIDSAVDALRLGATDYLTKPVDDEKLIQKLKEYLG